MQPLQSAAIVPASAPRTQPRVVIWDASNSSSILTAAAFRRAGWAIEWIAPAASPARHERKSREGLEVLAADADALRLVTESPPEALTLHGDEQVRQLLRAWESLPPVLKSRFLPDRDALEIALSKQRSMDIAKRLGVPVLATEIAASPDEVARAGGRLAPGGRVIVKADGGSAGSAVRRLVAGVAPDARTWAALTRHANTVMVQREILGPRVLVTVVYDRGRERAAVAHEKVRAWPPAFGVTAIGVTRHVPEAHAYAERLFVTLGWHGIANVELRQDRGDGRWYFMEINPRVPSSVGIQEAAGVDIAGTWVSVCAGDGERTWPGRAYREGVRFTWGIPAAALALRCPWAIPPWAAASLLRGGDDLRSTSAALRFHALRIARWKAAHEH